MLLRSGHCGTAIDSSNFSTRKRKLPAAATDAISSCRNEEVSNRSELPTSVAATSMPSNSSQMLLVLSYLTTKELLVLKGVSSQLYSLVNKLTKWPPLVLSTQHVRDRAWLARRGSKRTLSRNTQEAVMMRLFRTGVADASQCSAACHRGESMMAPSVVNKCC